MVYAVFHNFKRNYDDKGQCLVLHWRVEPKTIINKKWFWLVALSTLLFLIVEKARPQKTVKVSKGYGMLGSAMILGDQTVGSRLGRPN